MSAALDKALCERLGIEPIQRLWQVGNGTVHAFAHRDKKRCEEWAKEKKGYCERQGYTVRERCDYPDLNGTCEGMASLIDALGDLNIEILITRFSVKLTWDTITVELPRQDELPVIVARAAAQALGLGVTR